MPFLPFLPFFFFFLGGVGIGGSGFIFGVKGSRQMPEAGEDASGVCGAALEHSPVRPPMEPGLPGAPQMRASSSLLALMLA